MQKDYQNLKSIFNNLKKILLVYKKDLVIKTDRDDRFELEGKFDYPHGGKKKVMRPAYFAGLIIQSNYVGFYFMPIYSHKEKFKLNSELSKTLKGKSCFHIKNIDADIEKQIKKLTKEGFFLYRKEKMV